MKSTGLGDSVEKFTTATGIKKATKWIFDKLGKDCGCDKRKETLNKLFPYKNIQCLTEKEYMYLKGFFEFNRVALNHVEQQELINIHNRVFGTKLKTSSCGACVRDLISTMDKLYNEYEYERETQENRTETK